MNGQYDTEEGTMMIYNNDSTYGDGGPVDAASFAALADAMAETFHQWAVDAADNSEDWDVSERSDAERIEEIAAHERTIRDDFLASLSVVCPRCDAHGPAGDEEWICGATFGCPGY